MSEQIRRQMTTVQRIEYAYRHNDFDTVVALSQGAEHDGNFSLYIRQMLAECSCYVDLSTSSEARPQPSDIEQDR